MKFEYHSESAVVISKILFDIFNPTSVIDIGCGNGFFLNEFKKLGVKNVKGIDIIENKGTLIEKSEIVSLDLNEGFDLEQRFDIALCFEVAEHLNESSAITLVNSLINHSDIVVFSAAIPGQGGTDHINEKWPEFWEDIFKSCGYFRYDLIRPRIYTNQKVKWWYRQNILIYSKKQSAFDVTKQHSYSRSFILRELYEIKVNELENYKSGKIGLSLLIEATLKSLKIYIQKIFNGAKN